MGTQKNCLNGSFEHPKHMLRFLGKKYLQFYARICFLSKPLLILTLSSSCCQHTSLKHSLPSLQGRMLMEWWGISPSSTWFCWKHFEIIQKDLMLLSPACHAFCTFCLHLSVMEAQWLSGRVLDSRPSGRGFEPHRHHCVVVFKQDTFILA